MPFHAARLASSPRLQRLLAYLRERGAVGATTREIALACETFSVATYISELRANGFTIDAVEERTTGRRAKVFRYVLHEEPKQQELF